jgi:phage terminase large subunit-like protein
MVKPTSALRLKEEPGESISERRRRVARQGPEMFAKVYLSHLLKSQDDVWDKDPDKHDDAKLIIPAGQDIGFSDFHLDLFKTCDTPRANKLREAYIAPRGFAKSTAVTIIVLYWAAFKLREFVLWTSETASQVEELVASLVDEVEGNTELTDDFPHLAAKMDGRGNYIKWTDRDLVMESGFRLTARGAQKATRGLRRGAKRPDAVICDDAEGESTVGVTGFPKVRRWLTRVLAPALSPRGDIIWLNTLIDWVSVTGAMIRGDEDWTQRYNVHHIQAEWFEDPASGMKVDVQTFTFHAPGDELHGTPYEGDKDALIHRLLWPAYWPQERLDAFLQENGALAYSFEMLNKPMSEGDKVFRDPDWLRFARFEGDYIFRDGFAQTDWINANLLTHVTAIDPAFGGKDYGAVITIGIFQHDYFVREVWWARGEGIRTEQVAKAIDQATRWNSRVIIVEAVAAQILLADEVVRLSRIPVQPEHPGSKSKLDRALPVAIRASQHHVYFESGKPSLRALRELLLQFPGPMPDDPVDAFVYAIEGGAKLRNKFLILG